MKQFHSLCTATLVMGAALWLGSCQKSDLAKDPTKDPDNPSKTYSVNGSVQKGPFTQGTAITVQALDDKLNPTGKNYSTTTTNDFGAFSIGSQIEGQYVEIVASGYYFNEVSGKLSTSQITLRTISDLNEAGQTNINILTTLEANRIREFVTKDNLSVIDARKKAEQEIYNVFNIPVTVSDNGFDKADISKQGDENAILLAVSASLQSNRSEAEMSELIAKIASEIKSNGKVTTQSIKDQIRTGGMNLDAKAITSNLKKRYSDLGLQDCVVPNFEDYMDIDGDGVIDKNGLWLLADQKSYDVPQQGGTFPLTVSQNVDYDIQVDGTCDWVSVEALPQTKAYLQSDRYSIIVEPNNTLEVRHATITAKDKGSSLSQTITIEQQAALLTVDQTTFDLDNKEQDFTFTVTSNTSDYTVEITKGEEWITSKESQEGKYIFTASQNTDYELRAGEIIIFDALGNAVKTIPVNQSFQTTTTINVTTGGTLAALMNKPKQKENTEILVVTGVFNETDFLTIREMPSLKNLDLSGLSNTTLPNSAFKQMQKLEILTLPAGLTAIPNEMCRECSNLKQVFPLPQHITSIGESAFHDCRQLTGKLQIPDGVTTIGNHAFCYCQYLTGDLVIPAGVTSLGSYGYTFQFCYGIGKVYFKSATPPESGYDPLPNTNYLGVPIGSKAAYQAKWPNILLIEEVDFDALGL